MAQQKALVVDDNPVELENIKQVLSDAGVDVFTAKSGKEAIEQAKSLLPDIIFLDIVMPEMDGFATCRTLSKDDETKHIPVIFVSSKDQKADRVWAQLQGGKDYVTKPYLAEEILGKLTAA